MKRNLLKLGILNLFVLMFASFAFAGDPNTDCEDIGMTLVAKFEWDGSGYVFEKPTGNEGVITITGDTVSGSWTSTQWISAVIIKGGKPPLGSHTYYYDPAVMSGSFDKYDIPLDNNPAISNIQFCQGEIVDFDDLPDTYGTLLASNGARHVIFPGFFLGTSAATGVDPDADGQPSTLADGDDLNGIPFPGDEKDGVTFPSLIIDNQMVTLAVIASAAGVLDVFFDSNLNGVFDPGEQVVTSQSVSPGLNSFSFLVLIGLAPGDDPESTYLRIRYSDQVGLTATGAANKGETIGLITTIYPPEQPPPIPEFTTVGIIVALLGVAIVYLLLIRKRK